jgi:hypothetical protein
MGENNEMIERVARAMHKAIDDDTYVGDFEDGDVTVDGSVNFMALARAALEEMRQPTEAMIEAGYGYPDAWSRHWEPMIDAALK